MLKCLHVMCAKYHELRCMLYEKIALVKAGAFAWYSVKFELFSMSGLKDKKLIKKQTHTKTETCKLYSRVFWIFLPHFIQIDLYNFELYRFKVDTFFWDTVYTNNTAWQRQQLSPYPQVGFSKPNCRNWFFGFYRAMLAQSTVMRQ